MRDLVVQAVVSRGWEPLQGDLYLAKKEYETAVGPKTALMMFQESKDPDDSHHFISGHYQSEGRNILEPQSAWINKAHFAPSVITAAAISWADNVDTVVANSYAGRLRVDRASLSGRVAALESSMETPTPQPAGPGM